MEDVRRKCFRGNVGVTVISERHEMLDESWPFWAQDASVLIGREAVEKIMANYGGTRLYVPKSVAASHPLAELIGIDAAQALAASYGGEVHLDIPKGDAIRRSERDERIACEREAGESVSSLARRYRLTERQIRTIYRKQRG